MAGPLALLALFAATLAAAKNVTIDDTSSAWTYAPPQAFGTFSGAAPCGSCAVHPDPSQVIGGTWVDGSDDFTATLKFAGVHVTVLTVCPGPLAQGGTYFANFTFTLDGVADGSHTGSCAKDTYNYTVYDRAVPMGNHTLVITNNSPTNASDLILDAAIIDDGSDEPAAASGSGKKSVPAAAVAVPVVVVVLALGGIALWVCLRRQHRHESDAEKIDALPVPLPADERTVYSNTSEAPRRSGTITSHFPSEPTTRGTRTSHAPSDMTNAASDANRYRALSDAVSPITEDPELSAAFSIIAARARSAANASATSASTPASNSPPQQGTPRREKSAGRLRQGRPQTPPPPPSYGDATASGET